MDSNLIAIGIATLVVLILLMSCWGFVPKPKTHHKSKALMEKSIKDTDQEQRHVSKYGTGKINRKLANQYNDLLDLSGYEDYNDVMKYASLESEVFDSHRGYTEDIGISNRGAAMMTTRSDPNDVNNWVGLRRPDYHSVYAGTDARIEHSENPDQMFAQTHYML